MTRIFLDSALVVGLLAITACAPNPNNAALVLGRAPDNAAQIREAETRSLPGKESTILIEATQTLQDLGYTMVESSSSLGVLVGEKSRDATETGQVAAAIALTVAGAFLGVAVVPQWDQSQRIRITVVTDASPGGVKTPLRVVFDRVITNNQGISRYERLSDPALSAEFFERLGRGMTLNAGQA